MSRRLLKFTLDVAESTMVPHAGFRPTFLDVGWQGDDLVVWCEAEPANQFARYEVELLVRMTGQNVPDPSDFRYVGTAQGETAGHWLVAHVYERIRSLR